jgi:non-specific serine/threonine protein kinase
MALIGRERELATMHAIFECSDTRLLTLTGIGGGGKTRLALAFAREITSIYPNRIWLVELAAIVDPSLVPIAVSTAVGLHHTIGGTPIDALAGFLAVRPSLLILDNCEHVIDACAVFAEQMLARCPELRILATSREPLEIAGERQYRIPTLATPDPNRLPDMAEIAASPAVRLFVIQAQDVLPDFRLTPENAPVVARICARLDGIPLALELAAARIRVLGVEQILERLDDTFRLLTAGRRVAPTRQQTLRATLDWSNALLDDEERIVFRRLAVFGGEFTLEAAEAVCSSEEIPPAGVLDILMHLVDKSLVIAAPNQNVAWYRLLEPVRQYAMWQLVACDEVAEHRDRHVRFYTALTEQASLALHGPEQEAWLARLEREQSNLRNALEWTEARSDAKSELRLASGLVSYWEAHGHLTEGRRWLRQTLETSAVAVDPMLRIRALRGAGRLAFLDAQEGGSQYAEAEELHRESLKLAEETGDEAGIAAALIEIGMVQRMQRKLVASTDVLTDALARFRRLNDIPGIALALLNLGANAGIQGDIKHSIALLTESLERHEALGDLRSMAIAQAMLAGATMQRGDLDAALAFAVAAFEGHARIDDRWFVAFDSLRLASVLLAHQRTMEAVQFLGTAQALSEAVGCAVGSVTYAGLFASTRPMIHQRRFTAAWSLGHAMNLQQALEAVRALTASPSSSRRTDNPHPGNLTRREREIAAYLEQGYTDRRIAETLSLSAGTVGVHVHHILRKLGLQSRLQVAAYFDAHGWKNEPAGERHRPGTARKI